MSTFDLEHPELLKDFKMLGISKEDLQNMPQEYLISLKNGEVTPLILISLRYGDGQVDKLPLRLKVSSTSDGLPYLATYPVSLKVDNDYNLDKKAMQSIVAGDVLAVPDKLNKVNYYQLDPVTNTVFSMPEAKMEEKLREFEKVNDIELGTQQKEQIRLGKPVELKVGGENVVLGLSLHNQNGLYQLHGDMNEWKRQKEIEYDIEHPEFVGIVQTDANRWEKMVVDYEGKMSRELKSVPRQAKTSSMKL